MQQNSVLVSLYPQVNLSKEYLRIFYRRSKAKRTLLIRHRVLKNFRVHTGEQAEILDSMLEWVYGDSYRMLKTQYPSLSSIERILLAFIRLELSEKKIMRNTGLTTEEYRRQQFIISKKLKTPVPALREFIHNIFQELC